MGNYSPLHMQIDKHTQYRIQHRVKENNTIWKALETTLVCLRLYLTFVRLNVLQISLETNLFSIYALWGTTHVISPNWRKTLLSKTERMSNSKIQDGWLSKYKQNNERS